MMHEFLSILPSIRHEKIDFLFGHSAKRPAFDRHTINVNKAQQQFFENEEQQTMAARN